ncbi:MAG: MBL fold metallo-hydrolase, partial [Actinomycetes bacterium]
ARRPCGGRHDVPLTGRAASASPAGTVVAMALSLTVLGCSGTYAAPRGACSGYLVRSATTSVLLDCGPGTLANLQEHVALRDLDAVVFTHEHPDHWLELPVMRNALKYGVGRTGVPLVTTAGTLGLGQPFGLAGTFMLQTVADGDSVGLGDLSFRFCRTDHPVETLAVRVDGEGRSLGYSADTGPGWSCAALDDGTGLDLLVAEATFRHGDGNDPVHLTARQAGEQARAARARRLVVTHLTPGSDPVGAVAEAAEAYGAPVEAAQVHRTYAV